MLCYRNPKRLNHIKLLLNIPDNYHCSNHNNYLVENQNFLKAQNLIRKTKKIVNFNIIWGKLDKYLLVL